MKRAVLEAEKPRMKLPQATTMEEAGGGRGQWETERWML